MKYSLFLIFLTLALLSTGCDSESDPKVILSKSHDAMSEIHSFRSNVSVTVHGEEGEQRAQIFQEWAAPGKWSMRIESFDDSSGEFTEVIFVEKRLFTRDSEKGSWKEETESPRLESPFQNAGDLIPSDLVSLELLADSEVSGVSVFQVTGKSVKTVTLPKPTSGTDEPDKKDFTTVYTFLVNKQTFQLARTVIENDLGPTSQLSIVDFYDYNQPISIDIPEVTE